MISSINENIYSTLNSIPIKKAETATKFTTNKFISHLVNKLKSIYNLVKNTVINTTSERSEPTPHFKRQQPINIKSFINKQVAELDIYSKGKNDSTYADQTIDSILSSVYSERKDSYCINQTKTGNKIPAGYLQEIGQIAKKNGLSGKENKGIFEPAGAGANPFLTATMSPVIKRFGMTMGANLHNARLNDYAKQKIYNQASKLCSERGRIEPNEFSYLLNKVAEKYSQTKDSDVPCKNISQDSFESTNSSSSSQNA